MPSPPFIDYDSDTDRISNSSEWGYDHDDYWDQDAPRQRKRDNAEEYSKETNEEPKKKRRRVDYKKDMPGPSSGGQNTAAPTVIWKSKYDLLRPQEGPVVEAGQGEKIALLKDWRERFQCQPNHTASQPNSNPTNRRGTQIATAVVIGDSTPQYYHSTTLPPTTLKEPAGLPSRSRVFPSVPEHKYPMVNGTMPHTSDAEPVSRSSNPKGLVGNSTMAGKKRSISELPNHEENEPPAPKKRLRSPTKKTTDNPQLPKQPLANRTNTSTAASRKRKADDTIDPSIMPPRKRAEVTEMKGLEATASEGNGLANRTNTSIPASRKRKAGDSDDRSVMSPRKRTETMKTTSERYDSPARRTTRRNR